MGLPRVEEVFERRMPKSKAVVSATDGKVMEVKSEGKDKMIKILADIESVKKGKSNEIEYAVPFKRTPLFKVGGDVKKGDILTDGSVDIEELAKYSSAEVVEEYIINEINKIYELQGATISRKHIEVIVRQMFSRVKIKIAGDSKFVPGEIVESSELFIENERLNKEGKEPAKAKQLVLGITEVSLTTKSFLSAASFQHTSRVLINVAIKGTVDHLKGLKENIIIGRLIPAGTGFGKREEVVAKEVEDEGNA